MFISQDMYDVIKQRQRVIHIKINLLNFDFIIVNELSGVTIGDPSISIEANSDIRRTCSIDMCVKNNDFDIVTGGQIWLDKFAQIFIGIENIKNNNEIIWMNQGIYLINQPSVQYDTTTNTLSFSGIDLMGKLTGLRNGIIEGILTKIPIDSSIREVVIATLALAGFKNYVININPEHSKTPILLEFGLGSTVYDILKGLRDLYPQYQIYFDIDGIFHYELIPSGQYEEVLIDDDIWNKVYLSHVNSTDFENVKNSITVFGKSYDIAHYSATTTIVGSTYVLTIPSITTISDGILVGFTAPSDMYQPYIILNNVSAVPLVNEDGTYPTLYANNYYVIQYKTGKYYFIGNQQVNATLKDENPDSPFNVHSSVGEIRDVLSGGEYDVIPTNKLCLDRCKFELYHKARIPNNITISCVPVYWADVNILISFTLPNDKTPYLYMIQSVKHGLSHDSTQEIVASRYYPFYPIL